MNLAIGFLAGRHHVMGVRARATACPENWPPGHPEADPRTTLLRTAARGLPTVAALLALANPAHAQTASVGLTVGTLGVGPDASVSWNDWLIVRGGASVLSLGAELPVVSSLADNFAARLELPSAFYTLGAAVENSMFRFGVGVLYKHKDPRLVFSLDDGGSIKIGTRRYTALEITGLTATLRSDSWAPYIVAGLGKHNAAGFDIFFDVGWVMLTNSELELAATGESALLRSLPFLGDLDAERLSIRRDLGDLIGYWPIISLGARYGL